MTRKEHLSWCKKRARQYLANNNPSGAFASFQSDMKKHPETANHIALELGAGLLITGNLSIVQQVKKWIEGFN